MLPAFNLLSNLSTRSGTSQPVASVAVQSFITFDLSTLGIPLIPFDKLFAASQWLRIYDLAFTSASVVSHGLDEDVHTSRSRYLAHDTCCCSKSRFLRFLADLQLLLSELHLPSSSGRV